MTSTIAPPRHQESAARLCGHSLGGTEISRPVLSALLPCLMGCYRRQEQVVSVAGIQGAFACHTVPSSRSTWNDHDLEAIPLFQLHLVWGSGEELSSLNHPVSHSRPGAGPACTFATPLDDLYWNHLPRENQSSSLDSKEEG